MTEKELAFDIAAVALRHDDPGVMAAALFPYMCPCCRAPTLSGRALYDICGRCGWEDDGQDDHNPDAYAGGPNDCSLSEARRRWALRLRDPGGV